MRESREKFSRERGTVGEIDNYIYNGKLADGWQDLDIQDVTTAADMYDLPGWMRLFQ